MATRQQKEFRRQQRERRNALVQAAPALPDHAPPPLRRKLNLTDAVFPYFVKLYNGSAFFRAYIGSLSPADSPCGRMCFDDCMAAGMVKDAAAKVEDTLVGDTVIAKISRAIKSCAHRLGISRSQRLRQAAENLQIASAQPAE
jgi:hypothetical protein